MECSGRHEAEFSSPGNAMAAPWGAEGLRTIPREVTIGLILLFFVAEASYLLHGEKKSLLLLKLSEFDSLGPGSPSKVRAYSDISSAESPLVFPRLGWWSSSRLGEQCPGEVAGCKRGAVGIPT